MTTLQLAIGITSFGLLSCLTLIGLTTDTAARLAIGVAAAIGTGNAVSALVLAHLGGGLRSTKAFFGAIFGGMVLRMGTTLGGLLLGVKVLLLPAAPFAIALLAYTSLFTALEVVQWSRHDFSPRVQPS